MAKIKIIIWPVVFFGVLFFGIFLLPKVSRAATKTICSSGCDYNSIQACANVAQAGDTCTVNAGSYDEYVMVANSGTQGNPIIFQAAGIVKMSGFAIINKNYITIQGFEVTDQDFSNHAGSYYSYGALYIKGSIGSQIIGNNLHHTQGNCIRVHESVPSHYVIIKNNTFSFCGSELAAPNNGSKGMEISGDHILIEGNDISHVTDFIALEGSWNVVRNNIFHDAYETDFPGTSNPLHIDGIESSCSASYYPNPLKYALYENNLLYNSPVLNAHFFLLQDSQSCGATNVIVRYNTTNTIGSYFMVSNSGLPNIKEYNNTVFQALHTATAEWVVTGRWNNSTGGKIINNIYADTIRDNATVYGADASSLSGFYASNNLAYSSACASACIWRDPIKSEPNVVLNKNPLFMNFGLGNFNLQANSPAIDMGGPISTVSVSDSGTGAALIVEDAGMFQDGNNIVNPDWIAVGNPNNAVQISSINYSTNTITLTSSISRSDGNKVWLYKNSSGQQVLYGSAPDIGAYEYVGAAPDTIPPSAPTGVTIQ